MKHSLGENDWKLNKLMFELRYVVHEGSAERGARKSIMRKCNKFKMQVDTQGIQVTKIDLTYWGGEVETKMLHWLVKSQKLGRDYNTC